MLTHGLSRKKKKTCLIDKDRGANCHVGLTGSSALPQSKPQRVVSLWMNENAFESQT